ncbi:MAG: acetylxylan esterase [Clostridia bacterium]|nr:acetylxylan esterase [Clostridia bacterium]MBQ8430183.1 acetylxylan esterase [Clostridia bacterium]MBQ8430277.1 acetylxylan esterase [Clostridia bacterium]
MRKIDNDIIHEKLLDKKPLWAYDEKYDYAEWKDRIGKKYIELLGLDVIAENACPIKVEIEEVVETEEYTRYRYVFESEYDCPVPCYLLIPRTQKEKYPVCICLQGHTSGFHISIGKEIYDGDAKFLETSTFALDAVKNGYAALAVEQRGMGERTTLLQSRGRTMSCGCLFTAMTALLSGRTLIGERVWDVSKAIDSLEYFKDKLDLDDISVTGNSGGGTATYYSACYDKRIKVAVPSCAVCTYRDSIGDMWHCTCNYVPQIGRYIDMGELATLIAPRKLVVCHGEIDPIFPLSGTKKVYSVIEKIYEKENAADNCKLVVYPDKPHYFDKHVVFAELTKARNA